ncbi:MAG: DUF4124 domain-containing protein [Burkholderiaceae bacterium]
MASVSRLLLVSGSVALALCASLAHAQWMWTDAQGRRVYSDRPPPPDIPERNVLRQPGPRPDPSANTANAPAGAPAPQGANTAASVPGAAPAAAAPMPAAAASGPGRDPALEARKREQEQAEAARRKAEEDRVKQEEARAAAQRADNCNRVRQSITVLQSGQRMRVPMPNGEMGFMSDEQRAAEFQRLQQMLATECRG